MNRSPECILNFYDQAVGERQDIHIAVPAIPRIHELVVHSDKYYRIVDVIYTSGYNTVELVAEKL